MNNTLKRSNFYNAGMQKKLCFSTQKIAHGGDQINLSPKGLAHEFAVFLH